MSKEYDNEAPESQDDLHEKSAPNEGDSSGDVDDASAHGDGASAPRVFDPRKFRAPQSYNDAHVTEITTTISFEKPPKKEFIRFASARDRVFHGAILLDGGDDGQYLVDRALLPELENDVRVVSLYQGITQWGRTFLSAVPLPGPDGKRNPWHESLHQAALIAMKKWVRIMADMNFKGYRVFDARGHIPEPTWPKQSFVDLLQIAFRDRVIETLDHPVVRKLQGLGG